MVPQTVHKKHCVMITSASAPWLEGEVRWKVLQTELFVVLAETHYGAVEMVCCCNYLIACTPVLGLTAKIHVFYGNHEALMQQPGTGVQAMR